MNLPKTSQICSRILKACFGTHVHRPVKASEHSPYSSTVTLSTIESIALYGPDSRTVAAAPCDEQTIALNSLKTGCHFITFQMDNMQYAEMCNMLHRKP